MKHAWLKMTTLLLLALSLAGCAARGSPTAAVELGEFWITPDISVLQAGAVEIEVENYGEFPHTLVVSDGSGTVIAATDLINPDAETVLTLSLEPGVYMFSCRIVNGLDDGTVIDHYQQGMAASIEVAA